MTDLSRSGDFTRGDSLSRLLIDICADRELQSRVSSDAGFVELAQRHGVIPLLAEHVDDPLVRAIEARETARRSVLKDHLAQILTGLDDAGVRAVVLKGPAVASRYRNPRHRPFSDIDILVPEGQVEMALDLLGEYMGTVRVPAKRPKADKRDVLMRDPSGVVFNCDLHWDLFSYTQLRRSAEGATAEAWKRAERVPESPLGPLWEIPQVFRLAFLSSHAVLDHRFRLILFRDFFELAKQPIDWDELALVADRWGLRSTTYLALWLSKEMLGADIDEGFLDRLRPTSSPLSYLEWALPRTDVVRFDGHRPHPVNLASVLLNDSLLGRLSLLARAPAAFPAWKRRVEAENDRPDSPRTLIVVSTDRRRGAEVFTERLRAGLLQRGWVIEAVALHGSGEPQGADIAALVPEHVKSRGRVDWTVLGALRRKVRSYRPELIVANGGATLRYSLAARIGTGAHVAYIGIGEPNYWIRSGFSRWANRLMLRRADAVLTVSETTARQLISLEPAIAAKTSTTFTAVPDELFGVEDMDSDGRLRVVMLGSLSPEKDPLLALNAVMSIPEAVIRFVGDGPLRSVMEHHVESHRMTDRVLFTGSVEEVEPHLAWAQVLILTSDSEGLPGVILEAGAAGRAVVAVDVGGVSEAVIDGEGGFVVGRDLDQLVKALRRLDADRGLLAKMGKAGREHVRSRFGLAEVVERYRSILRDVGR